MREYRVFYKERAYNNETEQMELIPKQVDITSSSMISAINQVFNINATTMTGLQADLINNTSLVLVDVI